MKNLISYITGKPLWYNILTGVVLISLLLFLFMLSLNLLTHHGRTLEIPSVTGLPYESARQILEDQGFEVEIQDSIYNDTAQALSVLRQFPAADEVVKINRTVYLTINRAVPPTIEMPLLEGLSLRNAELVIKQHGLRMGDTLYIPDLARNAVLEQRVDGIRIKPGTLIPMGSSVTLVLGSGEGSSQMEVPDLVGLTYAEAKMVLESNGLGIGVALPDADVADTNAAYVYKQDPEHFTPDLRINRIKQGQSMDLFLGTTKPEKPLIDSSVIKN